MPPRPLRPRRLVSALIRGAGDEPRRVRAGSCRSLCRAGRLDQERHRRRSGVQQSENLRGTVRNQRRGLSQGPSGPRGPAGKGRDRPAHGRAPLEAGRRSCARAAAPGAPPAAPPRPRRGGSAPPRPPRRSQGPRTRPWPLPPGMRRNPWTPAPAPAPAPAPRPEGRAAPRSPWADKPRMDKPPHGTSPDGGQARRREQTAAQLGEKPKKALVEKTAQGRTASLSVNPHSGPRVGRPPARARGQARNRRQAPLCCCETPQRPRAEASDTSKTLRPARPRPRRQARRPPASRNTRAASPRTGKPGGGKTGRQSPQGGKPAFGKPGGKPGGGKNSGGPESARPARHPAPQTPPLIPNPIGVRLLTGAPSPQPSTGAARAPSNAHPASRPRVRVHSAPVTPLPTPSPPPRRWPSPPGTHPGVTEIESIPYSDQQPCEIGIRSTAPARRNRPWPPPHGPARSPSGSSTAPPRSRSLNTSGHGLIVPVHPQRQLRAGHLDPMENPSNRFREFLGEDHVRGHLAHHVDLQTLLADAVSPFSAITASTLSASLGRRQKGDHHDQVVGTPRVSRTCLIARHSRAKPSL